MSPPQIHDYISESNFIRWRNCTSGLPVPEEDKNWVSENLKIVDVFLDRPTELALNGSPITYRAVLETLLYGEHAHANQDKRSVPRDVERDCAYLFGPRKLLRVHSW